MARSSDERSKIIEILSENPSVHYACKKTGIARATHYRWMKDNAEYRTAINRALKEGRTQWTENAEAVLMKKVRDGNMRAVTYYLSHNDARYIPKRSVYSEPLSERERKDYERLQNASQNHNLDPVLKRQIMEALENYGIIKKPTVRSRNRGR